MPMWPRQGFSANEIAQDSILSCRALKYGSRVRLGPEVVEISNLFATPRGEDDSRLSMYTPFFLGIVEETGAQEGTQTLWVVFELQADGPRVHTPRVARPITVEEHEALEAHLRRHGSFTFFAKRRDHALSLIDTYWAAACQLLAARIPPELETFAQHHAWSQREDGHWCLPAFMDEVWRASKAGGAHRVTYGYDRLREYGFETRADMLRALRALESAWQGQVILTIDQNAAGLLLTFHIPTQ